MTEGDRRQFIETVRQWLEEAVLEGDRDPFAGKRHGVRYTWNRRMELLMDAEILYVCARDISEKGIGLLSRQCLPLYEIVHLRRDDQDPWIPGRVAHVTQSVGFHKVGAQVEFMG